MASKKGDLELTVEKFMYVFMSRRQNSGLNYNVKMANKYFKMWLNFICSRKTVMKRICLRRYQEWIKLAQHLPLFTPEYFFVMII